MKPWCLFLFLILLIGTASAQTEVLQNTTFSSKLFSWTFQSHYTSNSYSWGSDDDGNYVWLNAVSANSGGAAYAYYLQQKQAGITLQQGYSYTLTMLARHTGRGFYWGLQQSSSPYFSYIDGYAGSTGKTGIDTLVATWTNCSGSDLAQNQVYINAGSETGSVYVYKISLVEEQTVCATSSSSHAVSSSSVKPSSSSFATSNAVPYQNQIGYLSALPKTAIIYLGTQDPVLVKNSSGVCMDTATVSSAETWDKNGKSIRLADFSGLTTEGTYALYQGATKISKDFLIGNASYEAVNDAALKFFYYQRASMAIVSPYAGIWARSAGHPDNVVYLHSSTGASGTIASPRGWYDAGDYGKYIVNSGITTYTLMALFEDFPGYYKTRTWNIPKNTTEPDLLEEIRWNLSWMLTMQAADGGVYHKLTALAFPDFIMPAADNATRYAIGKTTAASFDFAAVMAMASRIYRDYDSGFADSCLAAARNAYDWGVDHPAVVYVQPSDVASGEYGDSHLVDEQFWASVEMALATGGNEPEFITRAKTVMESATVPSWSSVGTLGYYTAATHASVFGSFAAEAEDSLLVLAKALRTEASGHTDLVSMASDDFVWGSNAVEANQGIVLMYAYSLTQDTSYRNIASQDLNYILGRNPRNFSYVTGFGNSSPANPHHRISVADGITAPIPGMMVGGPHNGGDDIGSNSWECYDYRNTSYPALSYYDNSCSYATNEVAINWNAAFAYLSGSLTAVENGFDFMGVQPSTVRVLAQETPKPAVSVRARLVWNGHQILVQKFGPDGTTVRMNLSGQRK